MEMKRTILAVVLSMAVLLVFERYFAPRHAPAPAEKVASGEGVSAPAVAPAAPAPAPAPEVTPALPAPTGGSEAAVPETTATIGNDVLGVTFSSRGGSVIGAELKKFRVQAGGQGPDVRLLAAASGLDRVGGTRLIGTQSGWGVAFHEVNRSADRVVYAWEGTGGVRVEKTYQLAPGQYDLELTVRIVNGSAGALRDRLGVGMVQDFSGEEDKYSFTGPAYYRDGKYEEVKLKNLKEGVQASGKIAWAAFVEKYFLAAVVPESGEGAQLGIGAYEGRDKVAQMEVDSEAFDLAPGAETSLRYKVYLGPKETSALAPVGSHLDELVHYGFFNVVAKPLLWFLNAIYRVTGNYGIAIILLTTLIKAVFWPLSARSFRSMQRMKELQPKMQRLKERYANDRERMNMEVMQLYKTHKVNPLGGCLPMVVQIPFFFALYKILLTSIELRHAPFMLWIQDLSAKDPYYITPLLMGASMFLQQKMTPATAGNETQMKMMMYGMPVVFTFLFLNFPSGLVLYWLVNNLLSIAQQGMMLRKANT